MQALHSSAQKHVLASADSTTEGRELKLAYRDRSDWLDLQLCKVVRQCLDWNHAIDP